MVASVGVSARATALGWWLGWAGEAGGAGSGCGWGARFRGCADEFCGPGGAAGRDRWAAGRVPAGDGDRAGRGGEDPAGGGGGVAGGGPVRGWGVAGGAGGGG